MSYPSFSAAIRVIALVSALALSSSVGRAQIVIVTPGTNVDSGNEGIMGLNNGVNSSEGSLYSQFESGNGDVPVIIDGNPADYDTTWNGGGYPGDIYSFAGIEGTSLGTVSAAAPVTYLQVTLRLFVDGGWFGLNNTDPGNDVALPAADLIAPSVQVTTDGGTTWTTVADTNNYVQQLTNALHDNSLNSNVVTFALSSPESNIDGIRVIGESGGVAGGDSGFVGITEFDTFTGGTVVVPEPSTWALIGLGTLGAGFLAWRRRAVVRAS